MPPGKPQIPDELLNRYGLIWLEEPDPLAPHSHRLECIYSDGGTKMSHLPIWPAPGETSAAVSPGRWQRAMPMFAPSFARD